MTDTPKNIGPALLTNAAATQYTAPAGGAILRCLNFCNESGSAVTVTLSLGTDGTGKYLFKAVSVAANTTMEWTGALLLTSGLVVQAYAGTTNVVTLSGFTVELS